MKPHPKSRTLIEHSPVSPTWRIAERETTRSGFSRDKFTIIGQNYPNLPTAKWLLRMLKQGAELK